MKDYYRRYQSSLSSALDAMEVTDSRGDKLDPEDGFEHWAGITGKVRSCGGWHYFAGNGASAMISSHMSVDCTKNAGMPAMAFNDAAYLTAIGNDLGYENTFSFPLDRYGKAGDVLITISSSGNSPNIIKVLEKARTMGIPAVTLSGMKPDNRSRRLGELNFYIPARTYGIVECCHQVVIHCWLDKVMNLCEWDEGGMKPGESPTG